MQFPKIAASTLKISEDEAVYHIRTHKSLSKTPTLKLIDLFSGAGGLSLGFTDRMGHCFKSVWANDFNQYAADTYNNNFGHHCTVGDIVDILNDPKTVIPKADVVIGGPPCQGFSLLNKKRKDDARKQLWRPYMEIVRRSEASIFVMENVQQLLSSPEHEEIKRLARSMGFKLASAKLCAADYGVPQTRWRAFIIGCNFADPAQVFPPKKTHYNPNIVHINAFSEELDAYIMNPDPWNTVRKAVSDLPRPIGTQIRNIQAPFDLHFGRTPTELSLKRYKTIPKEGMNRFDLQKRAPEITPGCWIRKTSGGTDLFGRLWWDKPAFTIRTEFFKPEKGRYLHPKQHRPITHREAARLQSFPDDFKFLGTKVEIAKQIGNAVPPMLAARVADCVFALFQLNNIHDGCVHEEKTQLDYVASCGAQHRTGNYCSQTGSSDGVSL